MPLSRNRRVGQPAHHATPERDLGFIKVMLDPPREGEDEGGSVVRKEAELRAAWGALSLRDAFTLRMRLEHSRAYDRLAVAFSCLPIESRVRLIVFLRRRQRMRS